MGSPELKAEPDCDGGGWGGVPLNFLFGRGHRYGSQSEDVLVRWGGLSQQWEEGEQ